MDQPSYRLILLQLKVRLPLYTTKWCHRSWMQDGIAQYAFASRNLEKDKTSKVCSNPPFQAELPYKSNIGLAWVLFFFLVKLQNNCQCLHVLRYPVLSCREPKWNPSVRQPNLPGSSRQRRVYSAWEQQRPADDYSQQVSLYTGLQTSLCLGCKTVTSWL